MYINIRGEVNSTMNIYVQELQKVYDELRLHIATLNLINSLNDEAYIEDIQTVLYYWTDRLMCLEDEIQSILEF